MSKPITPQDQEAVRELADFAQSIQRTELSRTRQFKRAQLRRLQAGLGLRPARRGFALPALRWAAPSLGALALMSGVTFAAQSSLPGSALYGVKRVSERVAATIVPSFSNTIAVRRSDEARRLSQIGGDSVLLDQTIDDYLAEIRHGHGNDEQSSAKSLTNLDTAEKTAPRPSQTKLTEAARETEARVETKQSSPLTPKEDGHSEGSDSHSGSDGSGSGSSGKDGGH